MLWRLLPLSALLLCAYAQTIRIDGRVVNAEGNPIEDVVVMLQPQDVRELAGRTQRLSATTNEQGEFRVEGPEGKYRLVADKRGFLTLSRTAETGKTNELRMQRAAVISGRVTDDRGDSLAGASVAALRYTFTRGRRQLIAENDSVRTDDGGSYTFGNLRPGRYYLRAEASRPAGSEADVATYYPSVLDPAAAAGVDAVAGQERQGIDIRRRRERVYSIRGRAIETASGEPALNAALTILSEFAVESLIPAERVATKAPDGSFEFTGLLPGDYVIRASPSVVRVNGELRPDRHSGRLPVRVGREDIEGLEFKVDFGVEITGRVTMEGGSPLSDAKPQISLVDAEQMFTMGSPISILGTNGIFRLEHVPPSTYYLNLRYAGEDVYVKSIRWGGQDITRTILNTLFGGGVLEIVLGKDAGVVEGTVRDSSGAAVAGGVVVVWPREPYGGNATAGVRSVPTDENGNFQMTGLRREPAFAIAVPESSRIYAASPDFLERLRSRATELALDDSAHVAVTLEAVEEAVAAAVAATLP